MTTEEIWKDIPGYEGEYQASTEGRIKSLRRMVLSKNWSTGLPFERSVPERILRPGKYCKAGHVSVVLRRGSNGVPVHQLIMRTFVGEPPEGMEVLHKNGNPEDNRLENLRYGSRTENILDVWRQGKAWRKLTIDNVLAIRRALAQGLTGAAVAKMFGVSEASISSIKRGKTFAWLT